MSQDAIRRLTAILCDVLEVPALDISAATLASDLPGWDSGKLAMMVLAVEEQFNFTVRSSELDHLLSIGDWVELLRKHRVNV
jgi:acyl carrier protein